MVLGNDKLLLIDVFNCVEKSEQDCLAIKYPLSSTSIIMVKDSDECDCCVSSNSFKVSWINWFDNGRQSIVTVDKIIINDRRLISTLDCASFSLFVKWLFTSNKTRLILITCLFRGDSITIENASRKLAKSLGILLDCQRSKKLNVLYVSLPICRRSFLKIFNYSTIINVYIIVMILRTKSINFEWYYSFFFACTKDPFQWNLDLCNG